MRRLGPMLLAVRKEKATVNGAIDPQPVEAGKGQEKDPPIKPPKSSNAHAWILVQ